MSSTVTGSDQRPSTDHTGTAYETLRQQHLREMRARIPEVIGRLTWSAERLKAERERRLRDLIRIAKQRSAWQRERLAHVDPDRVTEESLRDIEPMTKEDLMKNFDAISTDPRVTLDVAEAHLATLKSGAYLLDRYNVIASGGSSGQRAVAVHDWDAWAEGYISFFRYVMSLRMRDSALRDRPMVGAMVAAQDPSHATGALPLTFSDPASAMWHRYPVSMPLDQIIDGLNAVQPDVLASYPSVLHQLAFAAQRGDLRIQPRLMFCTSEPLFPEIRAELASVWPVPLLNMWAATEVGPLGSSCAAGAGLHLSDDNIILEPVDRDSRPARTGERSAKVLVTSLLTPAPLPLIRYEITDEVTVLDEPCPCGSAHRRVADIQGRLDDGFQYGPLHVHAHVFRSRLGKERYIVEYQVRQSADGAQVDVCCNGNVDLAALRDNLVHDLRKVGLPAARIAIASVERMVRPASGKLKRFVPLSN
jgi:phenylacetate-coenzyme A ligase PaaK-like adenylate-forming protein